MTLSADDIQSSLDACPAAAALEMKVIEAGPSALRLVMEMPMTKSAERAQGTNQFHGGPIATLIDTAGDYAVALGVGGGVPTINFRVDYLRPAFGPVLRAEAVARRVGRTVGVADVNVTDGNGKLCAIGRCTYSAQVG